MQGPVGTTLRRPEGPDKVTGRALYAADLRVDGAWVGGTVRSNVARGRLCGFEIDARCDFERVVVVAPRDVPGANVVAMIVEDQPLLCASEIEHWGEPLLLLAAPDRETLEAALGAIRPRIEKREPVLDMEASQRAFKEILIEKGDALGALASAGRVVEGTYRTDTQEQMYIEPQGFVAFPPDERGVTLVQGSMQCPYYVQKSLARALGVGPEQARVVQAATGGGFGGKEDYPSVLACHAALLARKAGRPVRMLYDRHEDLAVTPKRHPSRVRHRTAVADDGRLLAMDIDVLLDGGAYTTLSPVVLSRACIHAAGAYECEHVRIRGRVVATNHVPYGAFRGFGAPQVCFAIERQMDRIAAELGLHPAALRERNMLRRGGTTATGQRLEHSVGSEEVLREVLRRTGFDRHDWRAPRSGGIRRGVGCSFFFHGAGFTGSGEQMLKARVAVELDREGRALVRSASTEFGQGTLTMFRAIAAQTLGTRPEDVRIADSDTHEVPNSGPTVASRTCMIVGGCLAQACRELLARVGPAKDGSPTFRERARAFVARGGDARVEVTYASPAGLRWDDATYRGDAYPAYGWAADVAEVEVDLDTFEVRVTRLVCAVDVGKAIQPQMVEGQIEGGSLQSIGFAHLEVVTARDGRHLQDTMATCVIPTTLDTPAFDVALIEVPFEHGPFGAKGVGELPMDGAAPAVASAIEDALGIHLEHLPATPERLMELWLAAHPGERLA
jgi:CO/xanthine dehydrogenase Mo-binding subunit